MSSTLTSYAMDFRAFVQHFHQHLHQLHEDFIQVKTEIQSSECKCIHQEERIRSVENIISFMMEMRSYLCKLSETQENIDQHTHTLETLKETTNETTTIATRHKCMEELKMDVDKMKEMILTFKTKYATLMELFAKLRNDVNNQIKTQTQQQTQVQVVQVQTPTPTNPL